MKSCFLFGHSDCPQDILPKIIDAAKYHYSYYGTRQFYVGNRGNFDRLAASALHKLKIQHPDVEIYLYHLLC